MNEDFKNSLKIIDLEDELVSIKDEIKIITKTIKRLRKDKKDKIKLNFGLTITELLIAVIGAFAFTSPVTMIYMLAVFIFVKLVDIKTFGTFENIKKEKHKLFIQKEILLAEHKDLENKLINLKLFSVIKKDSNNKIDNNEFVKEDKLEKQNIKKLILTKPNEI